MPQLDFNLRTYLAETLGFDVGGVSAIGTERLPPFLSTRYRFLQGTVDHQAVVFVADPADEETTPAVLRRHLGLIRERLAHDGGPAIVYVRDRVTPHNRKRLIQQRIPFVVPGTQVYVPELGIALRERFERAPLRGRPFRPATQAVLIDALLGPADARLKAADLAARLGYSTMTIGRAFDEIERASLARSSVVGKERIVSLSHSRRATWELARPHLTTPVKKRHFIFAPHPPEVGLKSGLSALAACTMLAEPRMPTIALSVEEWNDYRNRPGVLTSPLSDEDAFQLEVWSYPPRPGSHRNSVDPLSLFLSLHPTTDERVDQAMGVMIGELGW